MALTYSKGMAAGSAAPDFSLPGVDGETYTLASFSGADVLVVVFTCNHCPYAKAAEDRLVEIQRDYASRGVQLVAINPNDATTHPDDAFEPMKQRARERGFNFPYLRDESQAVARAYDAACTPDVFVFDADRKLRYNGCIDDNWQDPSAVTRHDLRRAIDRALEGEDPGFDVVASMGCNIKWKS